MFEEAAAALLPHLERRVAALRKARPELSDALDLQEMLVRAALSSARPPETQPFPLPRELVDARMRQGIPLLHDQPVFVDVQFAADLFSRLVNALQSREDAEDADVPARLGTLVDAATTGSLDPERLFGEAFVGHAEHLAELAFASGADAELLQTLATQATAPLLRSYAARLLPLVEHSDEWHAGYCPICGGWPLLGELRGVERSAWLRCVACAHGWRTQRLLCPYCGNDDYHTLGTLTIEGESRFQIATCERCKGYLKVENAFEPAPPDLLVLDDVASVHLDVAAIERGYHRPTGSGFTIELAVAESEWVEELA